MSAKASILVVSADRNSQRLLSELLTAENYQVLLAGSWELALPSAVAGAPQLILFDALVPGLGGVEAYRRLKANASTRDIPIILISPTAAVEAQWGALHLGALDVVPLPVQREDLLVRIESHLELHRLRVELERQLAARTEELSIDITELKRHQEQRVAAQKLEGLGALAAGIAHNFNNLLGAILSEADLALSESAPDSPARQSIERISAATIRASEIVDLLLAYSGTGEPPAIEAVDVSAVIQQTLLATKAPKSQAIVLNTRLSQGLPAVQANRTQIQRVVMNLVTNACEALAGQPGFISISSELLHFSPGGHPDLPDEDGGDYIRFTVSDTGPGMNEESLARIFDPFYTTKFLGRGLGLAVVQGIVRSFGGAITVTSSPGAGSSFEVLLPCAGRTAAGSSRKFAAMPG